MEENKTELYEERTINNSLDICDDSFNELLYRYDEYIDSKIKNINKESNNGKDRRKLSDFSIHFIKNDKKLYRKLRLIGSSRNWRRNIFHLKLKKNKKYLDFLNLKFQEKIDFIDDYENLIKLNKNTLKLVLEWKDRFCGENGKIISEDRNNFSSF
jgi:hypothetical protein